MKALFLLLAAASPVSAQIIAADMYADFTINDGSGTDKLFTIRLRNDVAPRGVANFIGLATGTRPWIDASTGETRTNTPFYNGQIIYKAVNNYSAPYYESAIWLGSQSGTGVDDPGDGAGYYIQDEFFAGAFGPEVYLDSSRPHGGGSRLLITTSLHNFAYPNMVAIGSLMQLTPATPERPSDDSWLNVLGFAQTNTDSDDKPLATHTIKKVEIRRVDLPALLFDELSPNWNLPKVGNSGLFIQRINGTPYLRFAHEGAGAGVYLSSTDLINWTIPRFFYQGLGTGPGVDLSPSMAAIPKQFYRGNSIEYPTAPSSDLTLPRAGFQMVFTNHPTLSTGSLSLGLAFNENGDGGTWQQYPQYNQKVGFSGEFSVFRYEAVSPYENRLWITGNNSLPNLYFEILHDINVQTGDPVTSNRRLRGSEWELGGPPGFEFPIAVEYSDFPYLNSPAAWAYFPAP